MRSCTCAGVGRADAGVSRMWYRRNFTVPADWLQQPERPAGSPPAQRVMLRFGAVDWEAEVFVNAQRMGLHRGGCAFLLLPEGCPRD